LSGTPSQKNETSIEALLTLDLIHTVAFAGLTLFAGYGIKRIIPPLSRYNIPAPVVGGILVALASMIARSGGGAFIQFDITLQAPLMIAFFTSIGFGASLSLLKKGGPQVLWFFVLSTAAAVLQNFVGVLLAPLVGVHPLFGVMCGSVTLTGGPATGLAFAPLFEQAGVIAAASVAIAAAMTGIISGGIIGGPIGTFLIERGKLRQALAAAPPHYRPVATAIVEDQLPERPASVPEGEDKESYILLKHATIMLAAMWAGSWVSGWFQSIGVTLPAYIGAMLTASAIRNLDDRTGLIGLSQRSLDDIGSVALSLFLALALMTLDLWKLADLALPLLVLLLAQIALIALLCLTAVPRWMGRDYDAAVMSSGFCGFMLGTTANAMANMEALVERYGPAKQAFLVVPMVGAFFIDFTNALIITVFLNIWR
jgi:glutamate:Na+ symporter, ESS family